MQTSAAAPPDSTATHGRLGRLGGWAADHHRAIAIAWCGVVLVLGALAPFADRALSGAGWEALDSESVAARSALEAHFPGARHLRALRGRRGSARGHRRPGRCARPSRACRAVLRSDTAVSGVLAPRAGVARSRPQHGGRRRPGGRDAGRDGGGGRQAQGPPRAAVGSRARRPPHGTRRDVVGLQRGQQGGDAQVRDAVLAADARAAAVRVRHAGRGRPAAAAHDGRPARRGRPAVHLRAVRRRVDLGDELRDDVRDRARDRLRALHRRPLPLGARRGAGAARRDGAHDGDRRQGGAGERPDGDRRAAGPHAGPGPGVPLGAAGHRRSPC